jgi:hypothetical protein
MLKTIFRVLLGLQGVAALLIAAGIFTDTVKIAAQLGVAPIGDLGISTIRGDIGGLFAGAGLFMLGAASRGQSRYLVPIIVFTGLALAARLATASQTGLLPEMVQPIAIEAFTVTVALIGYALFSRD